MVVHGNVWDEANAQAVKDAENPGQCLTFTFTMKPFKYILYL